MPELSLEFEPRPRLTSVAECEELLKNSLFLQAQRHYRLWEENAVAEWLLEQELPALFRNKIEEVAHV